MTASSTGDVLELPSDMSLKVWRYIDLSKYLSILITRSFFFSRCDTLEDTYEGSSTLLDCRLRNEKIDSGEFPEVFRKALPKTFKTLRRYMYINCWHMSNHESAAMWKLYSSSRDSIALQTTVEKLHNALPAVTCLGEVQYIDYNTDTIPIVNAFHRFSRKRKSFEHEREIRAIYLGSPRTARRYQKMPWVRRCGVLIPIDISVAIEAVYVSPNAYPGFTELVNSVTERCGFRFPVVQSDLAKGPVF